MITALWIIVLFLVLVFSGLPIAYSFGVSSLFFFLTSMPGMEAILISRSFGSLDSFPLMAIPFFILAGDIMKDGGVSRALIDFVNLLVGKIKGGLAHVAVVASTFFGAISGSSAATVAAIGGIMIPEMIKRGYDKNYAVAVSSASGFIGILIPPSIPLIVYGLNAQVSVAKLFLGGIVPGILMAVGFMIVNWFMTPKYFQEVNSGMSGVTEKELKQDSALSTTLRGILALIMPIIILGGIYSGAFTPTEAGAVAVIYSIPVSLYYYKGISWKSLLKISSGSALTAGVILIIITLAGVFGWIITTEKIPAMVADLVTSITQNPIYIYLMLNIVYLILGTFLETITAIVITTPIFLPLILAVGIDPIHFGVVQTVNLCVGLITPPMALNLLMGSRIGGIPLNQVVKPLLPYFVVAVVVLFLVTYIPELVLFLPNLLLS